jgi:predicted nucleic acid-binding protein
VIINALRDDPVLRRRARAVLTDSSRDLIVGDYVKLETLPKMVYNKLPQQVAYTKDLFARAEYVRSTDALITHAETLAEAYGLSAVDALHVASAIAGHADELVTFEKPEKPFFRVPPEYVRLVSLYG